MDCLVHNISKKESCNFGRSLKTLSSHLIWAMRYFMCTCSITFLACFLDCMWLISLVQIYSTFTWTVRQAVPQGAYFFFHGFKIRESGTNAHIHGAAVSKVWGEVSALMQVNWILMHSVSNISSIQNNENEVLKHITHAHKLRQSCWLIDDSTLKLPKPICS